MKPDSLACKINPASNAGIDGIFSAAESVLYHKHHLAFYGGDYMPLGIKELRKLWQKEKDSYRKQEVGSGVQKFVKEVLKCRSLFNLKEGKLTTKDEARKNEFLEEKSRKSKRADVIHN